MYAASPRDPPSRASENDKPVGDGSVVMSKASFAWPVSLETSDTASVEESTTVEEKQALLGQHNKPTAHHDGDAAKQTDPDSMPPPELKCILNDIDLVFPKGSLTVLVGPVGAGKSSLLAAFTNDIVLMRGDVTIPGRVAFVGQLPWVLNRTVRENIALCDEDDSFELDSVGDSSAQEILLGVRHSQRYRDALFATGLEQDIVAMRSKDLTQVGDSGVTLSGGQKQRLALTRAVYSQADVVVLDDILSAVDASMGRHIFDECLVGVLAGKPTEQLKARNIGRETTWRPRTRIIATHQVQYLSHPAIDQIVVLSGSGRVDAVGTYGELVAAGTDFEKFAQHDDDPEQSPVADEQTGTLPLTSNGEICGDPVARVETVMGSPSVGDQQGVYDIGSLQKPLLDAAVSPLPGTSLDDRPLKLWMQLAAARAAELGNSTATTAAAATKDEVLSDPVSDKYAGVGHAARLYAIHEHVAAAKAEAAAAEAKATSRKGQTGVAEDEVDEEDDRETSAAGLISVKHLVMYLKSFGSLFNVFVLLIIFAVSQVMSLAVTWWLGVWTEGLDAWHTAHNATIEAASPAGKDGQLSVGRSMEDYFAGHTDAYYEWVYATICVAGCVVVGIRRWLVVYGSVAAGNTLHRRMVSSLLGAKTAFYDKNPVGRVMNR